MEERDIRQSRPFMQRLPISSRCRICACHDRRREVIVDQHDVPVLAAVAKRGVETLSVLASPEWSIHPAVKIDGIRMLHESLRNTIVAKGYNEAYACVPPGD